MSRFATTSLIIGATGSGKTSQWMETINEMKQPGLIYTLQPNDKGLAAIPSVTAEELSNISGKPELFKITELYDYKKVLNAILNNYFNGNIMFDDIRPIMKSNVSSAFESILGGVRHNGNDLYFSFWHLNDVPPFLYQMVKHILLFKQGLVPFDKSIEKIPRYDEICKAYAWVLNHANPHAYAYVCVDPMLEASRKDFTGVDNYRKS